MWQFIKQKINKKLPFKDNASDRIPLKPKPLTEVILKYEDGFSKNYEDFLKYGLEEKSIQNIGVMGDYGVGKSSILKSFFYHNEEFSNKYLRVQLGKYFWENEEESKGNNRKNLNDHLEEQIIKQIVSQINSKDIPYSKFNIKFFDIKSVLNFLIPASVISFLSWVLDGLSKGSFSININTSYMSGIIILFILICTIWLLLKPITYILNFLAKFTFEYKFKNASVNVELNNFFKIDENIKEIVYLFSSTEKSIIIFEDLDRFDNTWIFQKLKELNTILNYYLETNWFKTNWFKKRKNKKITFIYLIRDDLLIEKNGIISEINQDNRTKILDLCIPIIPKINKHNSLYYLKKIFIKNEEKNQEQKNKFNLILNEFSWYLSDIREIHNIYNQYIIHKENMKMCWFFNESELLVYLFLKNKFMFKMQSLIAQTPSHRNKIYEAIGNSEYIFHQNLIVYENSDIDIKYTDDTFFICYFLANTDTWTNLILSDYISKLNRNLLHDCSKKQDDREKLFFNTSNQFEHIIHLFIKEQIITPNFFNYGSLCHNFDESSNNFNNLSSPNFLEVILNFLENLSMKKKLDTVEWNFKNFLLGEEKNIKISQIKNNAKGWKNEKSKIFFVSEILETLSKDNLLFEDFWKNFMFDKIRIYEDYKVLKNIFWVVNKKTKLKLFNKIAEDLPFRYQGLNMFFQNFSIEEIEIFFGIILTFSDEQLNWSILSNLKLNLKKTIMIKNEKEPNKEKNKSIDLKEIFKNNKDIIEKNKNLEDFFKFFF